jgi:hypothetical protein
MRVSGRAAGPGAGAVGFFSFSAVGEPLFPNRDIEGQSVTGGPVERQTDPSTFPFIGYVLRKDRFRLFVRFGHAAGLP